MRMKKLYLILLLVGMALLCAACSQQPPAALVEDTPQGGQAISAEPESGTESQFTATLYFRYGDTSLLRQETRQISLSPNETRERALVSALLEGSREPGSRPLFPEKAQVLSTQTQAGVAFITFNEALYDRYMDESRDRVEGALRRELALAALTATLTETGDCHGVQVLVRAEENVGQSMRLRGSFLGRQDDAIVPLLTRQHAALPTPRAYAEGLLTAWQQRDAAALSDFITLRSGAARGTEQALAASPVLVDFIAYDATVAPGGERAVVCADLTLRDQDGQESVLTGYPLCLVREGGAWKAAPDQLAAMMGENHD